MKYLWLVLLISAFAAISAAQEYPHSGSLDRSLYSNREFGMELRIPNGWTLAPPKDDGDDVSAPIHLYFSLSKSSEPKTLIIFKGVKFDGTTTISADRSKSYADTFSDRSDLTVTRDATRVLVGGIDMYRTDLRSSDAELQFLTILTVAIRNRIRIFEIHASSQHELDDAVALLSTHLFFEPAFRAPDAKSATVLPALFNKADQADALLRDLPPVYPPAAKAAHVTGSLRFNVEFGKSGRVQRIWLADESEGLSAPTDQNAQLQPLFVSSAIEEIQKFKFSPPKRNGSPIPGLTSITVSFTMD